MRRSEASLHPLCYLIGIPVHLHTLPAWCHIYRTPQPTEFAEGPDNLLRQRRVDLESHSKDRYFSDLQ